MSNMKVSVIIPTYKRSSDICRAVESVLNQTIDSFEVIVVDDNGRGTDEGIKTENIMKKYSSDPRVIYIQHEVNRNGSSARNTGIKIARGEYISFLDDDDAYFPERLEKMYEKMESLDISWGGCYTGYVKHQQDGTDQYSNETVEGNIFLQTLMRSFYLGSGSNMFFRRQTIEHIGLFDEKFQRNQDLEYLVRVTKEYKMAYVNEVLVENFYDIRTAKMNLEASIKRENEFRTKFSPFLESLSLKEKKEVVSMWDIDWIRLLITKKHYKMALKEFVQRRIPVKALIGYLFYVVDRKRNRTCYGYIVKL